MDLFSGLIHGFSVALTPMNLLFGFLGAVIGTIIGILPASAPWDDGAPPVLTYGFDPTAGMILFAASTSGPCTGARRPPSCSTSPGKPLPSLP